jgi:hypothetical protein
LQILFLNITSQHGPTHKQEKAFKAFAGNEIYETDAREDRITGRQGYIGTIPYEKMLNCMLILKQLD